MRIDGGVLFGRNTSTGIQATKDQLYSYLDGHGIDSALVTSYKSIFFDWREGNDEVLDLAAESQGRLIPGLNFSVYGFNLKTDLTELRKAQKRGARFVSFLQSPSYYQAPWGNLVMRRIVEEASKLGMLIQFGLNQVEDLHQITQYYGHLKTPILIRWTAGRVYKNIGEMIAVCQKHKNFYFDVGSVLNVGGIEVLVNAVGDDRLIFVSHFPENIPLSSHLLMATSKLSKKTLDKVMGGNLQRLLKLKSPKKGLMDTRTPSALKRLGQFSKIDTHVHIDGWNLIEPKKDLKFVLENFETFKYRAVIISAIRGLNDDIIEANQETLRVCEENAGVYGFIVVDPNRLEDSLRIISELKDHPKFVGIKTIQDMYGSRLDDENYRSILQAAERFGLPVMAHIPGMAAAAAQFPKLNFICAHATWGRVRSFVDQKNIYFDLATSHADAHETRLDQLVSKAGAARVLYSCDLQLMHPAWTLGKLASCDLSEAQLGLIFSENALRLFPKIRL